MRKLLLFIMVISLIAGSVSAQTPKLLNWYLQGGVSMPQEDFKDVWKMGYHGGVKVGLGIFPLIEPMVNVSYNLFPLDNDPFAEEGIEIEGADMNIITYGVEAKLNLGQDGMGLYVFAGGGGARVDIKEITIPGADLELFGTDEATYDPDSESMEYLTLGLGYQATSFFIEARYTKILDDVDLKNINLDADEEGTLVYIPISIGFKF